jgi:hypothetical protein
MPAHGYKLTPKPAPYRVFTRGHVSKMCPLPSLTGPSKMEFVYILGVNLVYDYPKFQDGLELDII